MPIEDLNAENTTPNGENLWFKFAPDAVAQINDIYPFFQKRFRPKIAIATLGIESTELNLEAKAISIIGLAAWTTLDQGGTTRRAPAASGNAVRVLKTKRARRATVAAAASMLDLHTRAGVPDEVGAKMLCALLSQGSFGCLVNGSSAMSLLRKFKAMDRTLKYPIGVVDYLVRCTVHPEEQIPRTIEHAKSFIWKWEDDCGLSKISKLWEHFKMAAPYLYAFHLERSFRPFKAEYPSDVLDWALAFVSSHTRVARFLGHAAFAMDVLNGRARDQRASDFRRVTRAVPSVRPFSGEERVIIASIDRMAPLN